jgi:hypothetical protein
VNLLGLKLRYSLKLLVPLLLLLLLPPPPAPFFFTHTGQKLPMSGKVFISMADKYKADAVGIAKQLTDMGYGVVATRGTASTLMAAGGSTGFCSALWFHSNAIWHPLGGGECKRKMGRVYGVVAAHGAASTLHGSTVGVLHVTHVSSLKLNAAVFV